MCREAADYERILAPYGIPLEDCVPIRFRAGETVMRQGFPRERLYVLAQGSVQARTYTKEGRLLALRHGASMGILGDLELALGAEEVQMAVTAETDVLCLAFPYRKAEELFQTSVLFSSQIARDLARRDVMATERLMADLGTGEQRLCAYLLQKAGNGVFREPLTQTAVDLGVSYRHLLRLLKALEKEKLVKKEPDGYHILDREKLAGRM